MLPEFQEKLRGEHTPVLLFVSYGNRNFDNSLAELLSVLRTNGFLKALKEGKTVKEIAEDWGCTENTVHNYLPYTKGVYGDEQASPNALKIRRWRKNRK